VAASRTRLLPVLPPLAGLLPDGALRRGTSLVVDDLPGRATDGVAVGAGALTLALALVAGASRAGSWCGLVGLDGLGVVAARDLGVDLDRVAVVPRPGAAWAEAAAALVDGLDLVVLVPPFAPRGSAARRLVARARERGAVLVVVPGRAGWTEPADVRLGVDGATWRGAGAGDGHLTGCRTVVVSGGRRSAAAGRRAALWLPGADGAVTAADDGPAPVDAVDAVDAPTTGGRGA
jgi:hypothetical protein